MPNIKVEFPKIIAVEKLSELGALNLKTNPQLVQRILDESYNGAITKEGKWAIDQQGRIVTPDPLWPIEKLSEGKYKITHKIGYKNTSLSVSLLQTPGVANIVEHHPEYFIIETLLDKIPTDMPFMFSLVKVISPPPSLS